MAIQVTRSSLPEFEEYVEEIRDIWTSRWLTNNGSKHQSLEAALKEYLGIGQLVLFSNGHLALEGALQAMDLTGEVITTPFTFPSTTHAIVRSGLTPVFADIDASDCTLDPNGIEKLITEKTSAILPVHVYGNVCDTESIEKIALKYGLKVIYDAAHTFGITLQGKGIASFGDASMFSFHATKVFNTIEGGAVAFRDPALKTRLDALKNFGITSPETAEYVGGNAKMNEFQAAMGLCNLKHVDEEIEKREQVVQRYQENLAGIQGIRLLKARSDVTRNYAYFPVIFDGFKKNRDQVGEELEQHDIHPRKYFYPLTSKLSCYEGILDSKDTPVALQVAQRILTLPLYSDLSPSEVDRICQIIVS